MLIRGTLDIFELKLRREEFPKLFKVDAKWGFPENFNLVVIGETISRILKFVLT